MEFRLEDYLKPTDVRPGYPGSLISALGDARDIRGNPDVDFAPAFHRILKRAADAHEVNPTLPPLPVRITVTSRAAFHFYSTLVINHPVEIVGVGVPYRSGSSRLLFHDCSGIHVRAQLPEGSIHLGGAYLEGLSIEYVGSNVTGDCHGVIINRTTAISRCSIRNFPMHGVHVEATWQAMPGSNASMSHVSKTTVFDCGASGVWIKGKDAQVMVLENVNSFSNGKRKLDNDSYGFYDASMLGNTYTACHTRNNHLAGYRADSFAPGAPNRSTFINCYTEHSAAPDPAHSQEGPALLDKNALVITSNGEGNLADAIGGASVIFTDVGMLQLRDVVAIPGKNGITSITGDAKEVTDPAETRTQSLIKSTAYGTTDALVEKLYHVHDPKPTVRTWGFKASSPTTELVFGITDSKHLRPKLPIAPRGLLIGPYPNKTLADNATIDGARRIGIHDPRSNGEATLTTAFPNALLGDVVLSSFVNRGRYQFQGWVYAIDSTTESGEKRWFRYGEVSHDPTKESQLASTFPNPRIGDVVLNAKPNRGDYNFRGWVYAIDAIGSTVSGPGRWFRFDEGWLGSPVGG